MTRLRQRRQTQRKKREENCGGETSLSSATCRAWRKPSFQHRESLMRRFATSGEYAHKQFQLEKWKFNLSLHFLKQKRSSWNREQLPRGWISMSRWLSIRTTTKEIIDFDWIEKCNKSDLSQSSVDWSEAKVQASQKLVNWKFTNAATMRRRRGNKLRTFVHEAAAVSDKLVCIRAGSHLLLPQRIHSEWYSMLWWVSWCCQTWIFCSQKIISIWFENSSVSCQRLLPALFPV